MISHLYTITIPAYMWWLHYAEIRAHLHCLVYILYRSYTSCGPTDVVSMVRVLGERVLTAEDSEGDIPLENVKVPGDNTATLGNLD